jgi:hypothetical protein
MENYFVIRKHDDGEITGKFERNVLVEKTNIINRRYIIPDQYTEIVTSFFSSYQHGDMGIEEVIDILDKTFKQKS